MELVDVLDVTGRDVREALRTDATDFEDELICVCAKRWEMDYIITRNKKDFVHCAVDSMTPEAFLEKFHHKR